MRIFLMGMPGSGKTTLGKKLAKRLSLPFIDLDRYISDKKQMTVAAIFANEGESKFRALEAECLKEIISVNSSFLLSLGGGTPCFNELIHLINKSGLSVYIDVPPQMLADRIKGKDSRPLFYKMDDEQILEKINELLSHRIEYYKKAHLIVSGKNVKPAELAQSIKEMWEKGTASV
jgi:shikimate kinase